MLWKFGFLLRCGATSGSAPHATSEVTKHDPRPCPATCREDDAYMMELKQRISDTSISVNPVAETLKLHQSLVDMFHAQKDADACTQARHALTAKIEWLSTASISYLDQAQMLLALHERRCGKEKMVVTMDTHAEREYNAAYSGTECAFLSNWAASEEAMAASLEAVKECRSVLVEAEAAVT